ncbi:hypothetical protein [Kitasatospora sp. NPDC096204]
MIADDPTHGWLGTIHVPNYAEFLPATSVILDDNPGSGPAFYADDELEAA